MRSLDSARRTCELFLPGLLEALSDYPLDALERPDSPGIELFRKMGGPGLVIPDSLGGRGAGPLQALEVTRALASAAPSLAVATTMHHFSVATLSCFADSLGGAGGLGKRLKEISQQNLLVASGFAEGQPGQGILEPTMELQATRNGYLLRGSKKPCSLSGAMDFLTASVVIPDGNGGHTTAVTLVPRDAPGLAVRPFWASWVLAGAQSDEVVLTDVLVQDEHIMRTDPAHDAVSLDTLQSTGFVWFELLITASYLGIASQLVERVMNGPGGTASERAQLSMRLETATLLLERTARMLVDGDSGPSVLVQALVARYGAQDAIGATVRQAVELLGGLAYIRSGDIAYLAAASHGAGFHPPSRSSFAAPYLDYAAGGPLRLS
ncbi:acyl-CoA dehydrogenase family protein [Streptomyces flavofungini]|uniref:Acyl-CoA/acyl-ACP dehydrogenase n=1 Tax=Streptomyces flavofungini TaxID=68200 RepID=A0ABS0XJ61_9ACTN|nr:acyl-CoA dehydrogenase family protein [Streptomyces flavofungini]MBJ3813262.1 acyl-CoA/acyl-ACP dehydrogenase [Streptomyces flavofungini]GHC90884.1 putative oxidoreductase [Streptomyces flavofungini]